MIKMNSTEKKVVRGKKTNKIKIQLYPKTALVRFITPNTVLKQRWKEKFTWIYIKNKKGDVSQIGSLGFIFLKVNAKYRYGRLQKKKKSHNFFLSLNPPTCNSLIKWWNSTSLLLEPVLALWLALTYRKWRKNSIASSLPELQEDWHTHTPHSLLGKKTIMWIILNTAC